MKPDVDALLVLYLQQRSFFPKIFIILCSMIQNRWQKKTVTN